MGSPRIQDMLLTIHNSISKKKAPRPIRNLINLRSFKYNLRCQEYVLFLPKVNTTKYALESWRYFAARKWNEPSNDIRIKVSTNEVVNRVMNEGVVSKETVVLRRWGSSIQKFGFINGVNWPPYRDSKRILLESLYGGQFTLSTPLIKPNFCKQS